MKLLTICLALLLLTQVTPARCAEFPDHLELGALGTLPAERESVKGLSDAYLLAPNADSSPTARDPRDGAAYRAVCYVYIVEDGGLARRFAVHVPDRDSLPFARRAARFYALVWGAANRRFGKLINNLRSTTVNVWMTRTGEAGGEQVRNDLYFYDILNERTGTEWSRELAHEYGHYLLPGASGYTDPEDWGNGVLGERLFLKWLDDDLQAGRLDPDELPFVHPTDLQEYRNKQVTPLIRQVQIHGPDAALLARKDRRAMDAFTGLLLYADETYGGTVLPDMLDSLPHDPARRASGSDFLNALQMWAAHTDPLTLHLPDNVVTMLYVSRGTFRVHADGKTHVALKIARGAHVTQNAEGWTVQIPSPGWLPIEVTGGSASCILHWTQVPSPRLRGEG